MTPEAIKADLLMVANVLVTAGAFLGRPAVVAAGEALKTFANSDQFMAVFGAVANAVELFQKVIEWLKSNHPAGATYLSTCE